MPPRGPLIFLAVALIVLLPFLVLVALPFLTSFILASILAVVMNPVKEWLVRRIHRAGLATFLTTFATVLVVGIVVAFASFTIARELTSAYDALSRRSLEEGGWPALVTHTADRIVDALATRLPVNKEAIRTELIDRMKGASGYLLNSVGAAVGGAANIFVTALLVSVFLYFLLRYGKDWIGRLSLLTPLDARTTARILRTIQDSVVANVNGVFAAAAGQGLLLGLGFWFVGVRSPALWGAAGGLASDPSRGRRPAGLGSRRNRLPFDGVVLEGRGFGAVGLARGGFRRQRAAAVCGRRGRKAAPGADRIGSNRRDVRIRSHGNSFGPPGRFSGRGSAGRDSKIDFARRAP